MYTLDGDLGQMAEQMMQLKRFGLNVRQSGAYPGFETETKYKEALKLIWDNNIDGWWHYLNQYIKYEICTEKQYLARLRR